MTKEKVYDILYLQTERTVRRKIIFRRRITLIFIIIIGESRKGINMKPEKTKFKDTDTENPTFEQLFDEDEPDEVDEAGEAGDDAAEHIL